jgi:hypothetical protein
MFDRSSRVRQPRSQVLGWVAFETSTTSSRIAGALSISRERELLRSKIYTTDYNPFPAPGQINAGIGTGINGPAQWAQTHPYPHITADC